MYSAAIFSNSVPLPRPCIASLARKFISARTFRSSMSGPREGACANELKLTARQTRVVIIDLWICAFTICFRITAGKKLLKGRRPKRGLVIFSQFFICENSPDHLNRDRHFVQDSMGELVI